MKESMVPYWLALVVALLAGYGFFKAWQVQQTRYGDAMLVGMTQEELDEAPPLSEFTLTERSGEPFHSRHLDGEVWVASFFFSACPGSCYRLNKAIQTLHDEPGFADVAFVSVTCDPATDSPAVLSAYAAQFGADPDRWLFCTGDLKYIQKVGDDVFKLAVKRQAHSDRAVVVDRAGRVRGRFNVTDENQLKAMRNVLADCLAEKRPSAASSPTQETAMP